MSRIQPTSGNDSYIDGARPPFGQGTKNSHVLRMMLEKLAALDKQLKDMREGDPYKEFKAMQKDNILAMMENVVEHIKEQQGI